MDTQPPSLMEDHPTGETPEDVAALYAWANVPGAKYRDFSANRREYRAQMRHRAAELSRLRDAVAPANDIQSNESPATSEFRTPWPRDTQWPTQTPKTREEPRYYPTPDRDTDRWTALKSVLAKPQQQAPNLRPATADRKGSTSILAVFSFAGGAGKTSLVATLGRSLSAMGEKVLLAETSSHGILPFYFGASEGQAGAVRTFVPPGGCNAAPIHLISYKRLGLPGEGAEDLHTQTRMVRDLLSNSRWVDRVLIDLDADCGWLAGRLAEMQPAGLPVTILVPLTPDMNSVISVQPIEEMFSSMQDAEGKPLRPLYLLNQFDASLPFHVEVREVLRQRIGERLLPFVIRRDTAVSEALAEGMTIADYDSGGAAAQDYAGAANWVRAATASAAAGLLSLRWSER